MEISRTDTTKEKLARQTEPEIEDPMKGYVPKKSGKSYTDGRENAERITTNLSRINKRYVATPNRSAERGWDRAGGIRTRDGEKRRAVRIPTDRADNAAISRRRVAGSIRTKIEMVTKSSTFRKPFPLAIIACCLAVTAVFMYVITLYVSIDDCNANISSLTAEINQINDQITALELRVDNKYDLDEIERIATEQYHMVRADTLPKKYISLAGEDVVELGEPRSGSGVTNLLSVFASLLGMGE
ncbi:MAG: septum formation initiator family protein [Clostridia bacterium]|nr:septum formation initiator family protein [Clostridia bacterium]